jgi:Family of unknown function (DUF5329)
VNGERPSGARPDPSRRRAAFSRFVSAWFLIGLFAVAQAAELPPIERQKIDFLINSIQTLQGAKFIRNGSAYDSATAANHLRLKLRRAGSRVKSADDFIRYCATASSVSDVPYQIRFADGRLITSESFLREKLADFGARGSGAV